MSDSAVRQRYALATGQGLASPPSKAGSPGFAKGGRIPPKGNFKSGGKGKGKGR